MKMAGQYKKVELVRVIFLEVSASLRVDDENKLITKLGVFNSHISLLELGLIVYFEIEIVPYPLVNENASNPELVI